MDVTSEHCDCWAEGTWLKHGHPPSLGYLTLSCATLPAKRFFPTVYPKPPKHQGVATDILYLMNFPSLSKAVKDIWIGTSHASCIFGVVHQVAPGLAMYVHTHVTWMVDFRGDGGKGEVKWVSWSRFRSSFKGVLVLIWQSSFISFHTLICNNSHEFGNGRRAKSSFCLALSVVVKGAVLIFS